MHHYMSSIGALETLASGRHIFVEKYEPSTCIPSTHSEPAMIFIHGLFGSTSTFSSILSAFPTRTRILYDLVGHATSPLSIDPPTMASLAQDVEQILDHSGLRGQKVDIIAHSAGSLIGLQFARTNPARVRKLVLMGPPGLPLQNETTSQLKGYAGTLRKSGLATMVPILMQSLGTKASGNAEVRETYEEDILKNDKEGVARIIDATSDFEWGQSQSKWNVETIVVAGREDALTDLKGCQSVTELTAGRLVVLETGHQFMFEDPEGTRQCLKTILKSADHLGFDPEHTQRRWVNARL